MSYKFITPPERGFNNTAQNIYFLQHFSGTLGKTVHSGGDLGAWRPPKGMAAL